VLGHAWIPPGQKTLYAVDADAAPTAIQVGSFLVAVNESSQWGGVRTYCNSGNRGLHLARPLRPVADLSVYTPPFRIVDQRELWGW